MALTEDEEFELLSLEREKAMATQASPAYQPSMLERTAGISQGVQEAVLGPVMQAGSAVIGALPYPLRKSAEAGGALLEGIGRATEAAGGYVAEKAAQPGSFVNRAVGTMIGGPLMGGTQQGQEFVSNPYIAGAAGTVVANAPYFATPVGGAAGPLPGAASAARRTLFGKQNLLKKIPGGIPEAEKIGMEMLDKGVIGPFASKETMLARAEALKAQAGKPISQITQAADSVATRGIDAEAVAGQIEKELAPRLKKGAFQSDVNTIKEIVETVKAAGPESTFADAQAIKQKLQTLGQFPKGQVVDQVTANKINMYRRASGIFNDAMEKALKRASPKMSAAYEAAKSAYGPAKSAVRGLSDAYITEAANVVPSVRGTVMAGASLAAGDIPRALASAGAMELASRKGAQMAAYTLGKAIPSTVLSPAARRAILSQYVDRITTKENSR